MVCLKKVLCSVSVRYRIRLTDTFFEIWNIELNTLYIFFVVYGNRVPGHEPLLSSLNFLCPFR